MAAMKKEFITIKGTTEALRLLRWLAAKTGKKQYAVLEQALQAEKQRVNGGTQ